MLVKIRIKNKEIQDCSFNERVALALIVSHCESLMHYVDSMARTADVMIAVFSGKKPESLDEKLSTSARSDPKNIEAIQKSGKAFALKFFPEFEFDFSVVEDVEISTK